MQMWVCGSPRTRNHRRIAEAPGAIRQPGQFGKNPHLGDPSISTYRPSTALMNSLGISINLNCEEDPQDPVFYPKRSEVSWRNSYRARCPEVQGHREG